MDVWHSLLLTDRLTDTCPLLPAPLLLQALGEIKEHWHGLPEQIALEVHFSLPGQGFPDSAAKNGPQMSLLFSHLANLGYAVVARDDNPHMNLGCCAEFTFLKVENRLRVAEVGPDGAGGLLRGGAVTHRSLAAAGQQR